MSTIRYLGLARVKDEMAIPLSSIRDELMPGLLATGRKNQMRIESYVEFNTDMLVIRAGEPGNWIEMRISRYEVEDGKHIAKLREFLTMCGSKGSIPVTQSQAAELARYQQLVQQQSGISPYNQGLADSFAALKRMVIGDNLYKGEMGSIPEKPVPQITAKELTKEELREKIARKLDLDETKITTAAEVVNHGRWRQIMDEVFKEEPKDEPKGEHDGERTQAGSNGGRKRGDGGGGDDAG